jgi:MFS family permease
MALAAYHAPTWPLALALLFVPTVLNSFYYGPCYSAAQGLVPLRARAIAAAALLFFQNLIGLGLGPLFFGMLSDWLQPTYGADSVRYVLYGAAVLGLVPAFFFWRCGLRLNEELDQKG